MTLLVWEIEGKVTGKGAEEETGKAVAKPGLNSDPGPAGGWLREEEGLGGWFLVGGEKGEDGRLLTCSPLRGPALLKLHISI